MPNQTRGVSPRDLNDDDLVREVDHLHATRGDALRGGTESALRNHTERQLALEAEFLRRFPAAAAPDPARTRAGRRAGTGQPDGAAVLVAAVITCPDPEVLAAFWSAALGARVPRPWTDPHGTSFIQVDDPAGEDVALLLQRADAPGGAGMHLDLAPAPGRTQADEVARLQDLGAKVCADDPDLPWVVMADPGGNVFCVLPR